MSQLSEDPKRPGYVNTALLEDFCGSHPDLRGWWPAHSVDMVTGAKSAQYYLGHAQGYVPSSHDAAAHFWQHYVNSPCIPNASTQSRLIIEPMNECGVHAQELGTNFSEMTQRHIAIAERLHASTTGRRVLVGGPTSAYPAWQLRNFSYWQAEMGYFISKAARSVDFLSCHLYDTEKGLQPEETDNFRAGSNTQAILDLHEAYSASRTANGAPLPHLISEYGGGFKMSMALPYEPAHDWFVLRGVNGKLLELLDRPDRLVKSIPFIVGRATWDVEVGNKSYPFALWRQAADHKGPWLRTALWLFYELYSELDGHRVSSRSDQANLQAQAFANSSGSCWLLLNNLLDSEITVSIDWGALSGAPSLHIKRLYYDTATARPTLSSTENATLLRHPHLTLMPYEAVVLRVQGATGQPEGATQVRSDVVHHSQRTLVPAHSAGVTHEFPVALSGGTAAASVARIRVGFGGPYGVASCPPNITLDGQAWVYDAEAVIGGHINQAPTGESFLLVDVPRPAKPMADPIIGRGVQREEGQVVVGVEFQCSLAITISSVVVVTSVVTSSRLQSA
uniref:Uncharacterized protein n=1 Tax=Haptolina brevifila TaxID=156173 RepID=A0A7S2BR83_9EUKA